MKFHPTQLADAVLIEPTPHHDDRGFFARTFCAEEFAEQGLPTAFPQCNLSYNRSALTLRGMHYNRAPHEETKLVRCQRGRIWDVIVDLRPTSSTPIQRSRVLEVGRRSSTRDRWIGVELSADNRHMLFVPAGFAHGFLTLESDSEVFYHMGSAFVPGAGTGFRYNDPHFGIRWPEAPVVISERDRTYPDFRPEAG